MKNAVHKPITKEAVIEDIIKYRHFFGLIVFNYFRQRKGEAYLGISEDSLSPFMDDLSRFFYDNLSKSERHFFYHAIKKFNKNNLFLLHTFFDFLPSSIEKLNHFISKNTEFYRKIEDFENSFKDEESPVFQNSPPFDSDKKSRKDLTILVRKIIIERVEENANVLLYIYTYKNLFLYREKPAEGMLVAQTADSILFDKSKAIKNTLKKMSFEKLIQLENNIPEADLDADFILTTRIRFLKNQEHGLPTFPLEDILKIQKELPYAYLLLDRQKLELKFLADRQEAFVRSNQSDEVIKRELKSDRDNFMKAFPPSIFLPSTIERAQNWVVDWVANKRNRVSLFMLFTQKPGNQHTDAESSRAERTPPVYLSASLRRQ